MGVGGVVVAVGDEHHVDDRLEVPVEQDLHRRIGVRFVLGGEGVGVGGRG